MFRKQKALSILFKENMKLFLVTFIVISNIFIIVAEPWLNVTDTYYFLIKYIVILSVITSITLNFLTLSNEDQVFYKMNDIRNCDITLYFYIRILLAYIISIVSIYFLSYFSLIVNSFTNLILELGLYNFILIGVFAILGPGMITQLIINLIVKNPTSIIERLIYVVITILISAFILGGTILFYSDIFYLSICLIGVIIMYYIISLLILKRGNC